uniref:(northern house mosquito) hypothetical protein n=1 Tax=Culex pipiens TaxID=7175 RepID=A0A8D8NTE2_CULPI
MHNCATVQLRFSATFWRFFRTFSRIFRALFVRFSRPTRTKNVPAHFCTVHFALLFASRPTLRALNCSSAKCPEPGQTGSFGSGSKDQMFARVVGSGDFGH